SFLPSSRRTSQYPYHRPLPSHHRPSGSQKPSLLRSFRHDPLPAPNRSLLPLWRIPGDIQPLAAGLLLVLRILLRRLHLRRSLRAPLGDVPHQSTRTRHVHSRLRPVDRNVPDRTAHPLDAPKPDPRRNILPVRHHVRTLYAHRLETRAGNHRQVPGRNREILDPFGTVRQTLII
ncbi:hypothetical protein SAMN05444349_1801, partial [Bacteroides faecichinchillae]